MFKGALAKYCHRFILFCPFFPHFSQRLCLVSPFKWSCVHLLYADTSNLISVMLLSEVFLCGVSLVDSLPHYICFSSLTSLWCWCSLFVFVSSTTPFFFLSHILYGILRHLICSTRSSTSRLSSAVCEPVSSFSFVSFPRPFYSSCFCQLGFFFLCSNCWPFRPCILAIIIYCLVFGGATGHEQIGLLRVRATDQCQGPTFSFVKHFWV